MENEDWAQQTVNSEGVWSFYHNNVDKNGNFSNIYHCNSVKYTEEQCVIAVYLSYSSRNSERIHMPVTKCPKILKIQLVKQ